MNPASSTLDMPLLSINTLLEPVDELGVLSERIQGLFARGLSTDNVSLIHDAGKLLEELMALGTQHRLFAKLTDAMVNITKGLPYERTLKDIEMGLVSSDVFHALFQYVSPRMGELGELVERAPDVVGAALEAMIRNGLIRQREVNELASSLFGVPDNRALTLLLDFKLKGLRAGVSEYFNVPYLISEYFAEAGLPKSLQDAGALGQFLIRELPVLTVEAERAEKARKSGQANLFSMEALEVFAASGFEKEASRMAAFYLEFDLKDDRYMSRLARLGHGQSMAKKVVEAIKATTPITTAQLNFCLESPLVSIDQSSALLCVDSSRLSASAVMEALGHALSAYPDMNQGEKKQLLEKTSLAIERFVELLNPMSILNPLPPRRWRNVLVDGLRNIFFEYGGLDEAGKSMVEEKSIWAMGKCLARLDGIPAERSVLQGQLLGIEQLPPTMWESVDWMKTHTLEADLGL
jgi:hypothetical protein